MFKINIFTYLLITTFIIASCYYVYSKSNLIPRELFFGNPKYASTRISPDGNYMIYLTGNESNILNIWIRNLQDKSIKDKQITFDKKRSIRSHMWALNGKQVLYLQDQNGNENWQLFGVNIETGEIKNYTPFENVQVQILDVSYDKPNIVALLINKENISSHDLYYLNLDTGELTLGFKNMGGITSWVLDKNLNLCAAVQTGLGSKVFACKNSKDTNSWKQIAEWSLEDSQVSQVLGCNTDGSIIYLKDSRDYPTARLLKVDLEGKILEVVAADPNYDLETIRVNPISYEIEGYCIVKDKEQWIPITPEFSDLLNNLKKISSGNIYITSCTKDNSIYTVAFENDIKPLSFYLYNNTTKSASFLFESHPKLTEALIDKNGKTLAAHMKPISFQSRDGLTIHGYLTLPVNKQDNYPLVVNVHGGPWVRDTWHYNPEVQWLANRGYAVLQINYRGSTGYGKAFVAAANKEWGRNMHNDIIDGVNWAIENNVTTKDKVAIYGGSYGGYEALVGASMTPDVFKCAVDIVGVSNLVTFLDSIPPYWSAYLTQLHETIGNPGTDLELLKERSPINHIDNIKIPILIAQGAQDPRVKQAESEQIVAKLKAKGLPYKYLLFKDEGHGFVNQNNRLKYYRVAEKFLSKYLGGYYRA